MSIDMRIAVAAAACMSLALVSLGARAEEQKPAAAAPADAPASAAGGAGGGETPAAGNSPAGTAVGAGAAWTAEVAPSGGGIALDAKQAELVKKVSDYFNSLGDLKGNFVQITADQKRMKGKFFVKRPGRFRFDYALPSKQIIISDGEYLAIQDLDLNNEDRIALDQTPFRLLVRKDVDLVRDARIIEVQEAEDLIVLGLQDKSPDVPSKIKLFFATKPQLEIKEWVTTDGQGLDTRVEVTQLVKGEQIDGSLFKIEPVTLNKFHPQ
jgi:outer membrane lipoprotein-sorting protein